MIEAGRGLDQISMDATLGVPVTIRGGQGFDQLIVNGLPAVDVSYTPDGSYQFIPGNESYGLPFLNDRREYRFVQRHGPGRRYTISASPNSTILDRSR